MLSIQSILLPSLLLCAPVKSCSKRLCSYEHQHTTPFLICILLHKSTYRSYSFCVLELLVLHALDYVYQPLVMYLSVTMAASELFALLVSWQRCSCRGKLLRAQCVWSVQSLRAINNLVELEPCPSWGLASRMRRICFGAILPNRTPTFFWALTPPATLRDLSRRPLF